MNYKYYLCYSLIAVILHLTALSNDSTNYKQFHLTGNVIGLKKGTIYLRYVTEHFGMVWDSCTLQNGNFHFKGKVNEPTVAELSFDREMPWGRNRAEVFLEGTSMTIKASKNSFYALQMSGSISQNDYEKLSVVKRTKFLELLAIQEERKRTKAFASGAERDSLKQREFFISKALDGADSLFIVQHPTSFVTAYLLKRNIIVQRISFDPVDSLYNRFPSVIKNSSYGKKILWHMDKVKKVPLGEPAPAFSAKTINGDVIDIKQFQGKGYVLLDFWASWCFPCRMLTPLLKDIYSNFHNIGLEIISIAIKDKEEAWKSAIAKDSSGMWQHILDDDTIMNKYAANYIPSFYLIDKEGKVIARYSGGERSYGEKPIWELYGDLSILLKKEDIQNR